MEDRILIVCIVVISITLAFIRVIEFNKGKHDTSIVLKNSNVFFKVLCLAGFVVISMASKNKTRFIITFLGCFIYGGTDLTLSIQEYNKVKNKKILIKIMIIIACIFISGYFAVFGSI